MESRFCPECGVRDEHDTCPKCGTRTLVEASADLGLERLVGLVLDARYRLDSFLGKGGMGAVFRATQIAMNNVVAIKVVKPEYATEMGAARRFHREAKAASSLSHPHTIRVFDFGQTPDRQLYMVMEYLNGRTLGQLIKDEGRLPTVRAAKIGAAIASSLSEAHEKGIIHRDLKPDNVFLLPLANDEDYVKVLDFGLAKFVSGDSDASSVTQSGCVVGTPYYMSPEQARGDRVLTGGVDVYALGVILFEMLTGRLPYPDVTPVEAMMAHLHLPVARFPTELNLPDGLAEFVRSMLSKVASDRPSIQAVASLLEELRMRHVARSFLEREGHPGGGEALPRSIENDGIADHLALKSLPRGETVSLDYVEPVSGSGSNPSAPPVSDDAAPQSLSSVADSETRGVSEIVDGGSGPRRGRRSVFLFVAAILVLTAAIGVVGFFVGQNAPGPVRDQAVVPAAAEVPPLPATSPRSASPAVVPSPVPATASAPLPVPVVPPSPAAAPTLASDVTPPPTATVAPAAAPKPVVRGSQPTPRGATASRPASGKKVKESPVDKSARENRPADPATAPTKSGIPAVW